GGPAGKQNAVNQLLVLIYDPKSYKD
nr:RecName: Full=Hemocyanin subunit 3 [Maja squinado]